MRIDVTTHTYRAHMHMCMWIYTRRALLLNSTQITSHTHLFLIILIWAGWCLLCVGYLV